MAKAKANSPIYYFDSCLFLSLINEEPNRWKMVEALLNCAEQQECEVYTSQLTVCEVGFGDQEKKGKALSTAAEKKIDKLWHPTSPVRLIDLHCLIAVESRKVIRQAMKDGWTKGEDWSVKPPDAIHIATAKWIRAKHLFTYDQRLLKLKKVGIDICEPFLVQGVFGIP